MLRGGSDDDRPSQGGSGVHQWLRWPSWPTKNGPGAVRHPAFAVVLEVQILPGPRVFGPGVYNLFSKILSTIGPSREVREQHDDGCGRRAHLQIEEHAQQPTGRQRAEESVEDGPVDERQNEHPARRQHAARALLCVEGVRERA